MIKPIIIPRNTNIPKEDLNKEDSNKTIQSDNSISSNSTNTSINDNRITSNESIVSAEGTVSNTSPNSRKSNNSKLVIDLPKNLKFKLKIFALQNETSVSDLMRKVISELVDNPKT